MPTGKHDDTVYVWIRVYVSSCGSVWMRVPKKSVQQSEQPATESNSEVPVQTCDSTFFGQTFTELVGTIRGNDDLDRTPNYQDDD